MPTTTKNSATKNTTTQNPTPQSTTPAEDMRTGDFLRAPLQETMAMTGGWLEMVQAHHQMIEQAFDALIESGGSDFSGCVALHKRLAYLLTAHSVAEENVLYPALAMCNLQSESDRLYLDQAHAKVMNAVLDMSNEKCGAEWLEKVSQLKAAVLQHAKVDEEGDLYPRLAKAIDKDTADKLDMAYRREFVAVKPLG
jgi:hemerythrin superfamily protein